jgi:hypothetical protein
VGLVTGVIAWVGVALRAPHMPTIEQRRQKILMHHPADSEVPGRAGVPATPPLTERP